MKATMNKVNTAALNKFLELRDRAVAEHIRASDAIRRVMNEFKLSRAELKHTAAAAGIHPLTARNVYDRIQGA